MPDSQDHMAGDILISQGDQGNCAFYIENGEVEITRKSPAGHQINAGRCGAGEIIGEMGLLTDHEHTTTACATTECTLTPLDRQDFNRRLQNAEPLIQHTLAHMINQYRLARETSHHTQSGNKTSNEDEDKALAAEFEKALGGNDLSLVYQPIFELASGRIEGVEALMRWHHPEWGTISPGRFIPVAEATGLIVDASQWVLNQACKTLKRLESRIGYNKSRYMSVNFTSKDFAEASFIETLYDIISTQDVMPRQINLEITEETLMSDPDNARESLKLCSKAGLGIAIDDFGLGDHPLNDLDSFAINTLKIDKTFIRDMTNASAAYELVEAMITLARSLDMMSIGEGVEYAEEADILNELGCDSAQGFYYAKPMPERELTDFMRIRPNKSTA